MNKAQLRNQVKVENARLATERRESVKLIPPPMCLDCDRPIVQVNDLSDKEAVLVVQGGRIPKYATHKNCRVANERK